MDKHRIPAPSEQLKEHVLQAARDAWDEDPATEIISWPTALLRLAACLMAAITLIFSATHTSETYLSAYTPEKVILLSPIDHTDNNQNESLYQAFVRRSISRDGAREALHRREKLKAIYENGLSQG